MISKLGFFGRGILIIFSVLLFSFCVNQKRGAYKFPKAPTTWYSNEFSSLNGLKSYEQAIAFEKSLVVLKNESKLLPLGNLKCNISLLSIGGSPLEFKNGLELFANVHAIQVPSFDLISNEEYNSLEKSDFLIVSVHANQKNQFSDSLNKTVLNHLPEKAKKILVVFGESQFLNHFNSKGFEAIVLAHENHEIAQVRTAQLIFGAIGTVAKLNHTLDIFPKESGVEIKTNGRLKFAYPEEVGIDSERFKKIDEIALNGITTGAYPGCQIVVAVEDKIIFRKSYGAHTYENKSQIVQNTDVYDIASVTKIAASTLLAMHLNWKKEFDLNKSLGDYIPDVTGKSGYGSIVIRDMMAHQAGLTPWIAFYKRTLKNGQLNPEIYSSVEKDGFDLKVADGVYMKRSYVDSMYKQITSTPLGTKKYEYSDLCYYFTQKIIEKQIGMRQDLYLLENIYKPMGLRYARYLPLNYFEKTSIVPTEKDMAFRKQLLYGTVHDPGAAMLGGVAGHAGLFCNATDLASIMEVFLNKGQYGGMQFFDGQTTNEFTKQQFPGNRRGAGFDRPNTSGGGTCDKLASQQSFGHSGFTGTLAWADPKDKVIFVFLSNRVHPDQDNWKLRDMGIRTDIQHVVYEAVNSRKKE
jgi:CubicO group peptidase (beta-lactamase class C family)